MERLKELGTWVLLVIAFFLFSNGLIYIWLHGPEIRENRENKKNNVSIVNKLKN